MEDLEDAIPSHLVLGSQPSLLEMVMNHLGRHIAEHLLLDFSDIFRLCLSLLEFTATDLSSGSRNRNWIDIYKEDFMLPVSK